MRSKEEWRVAVTSINSDDCEKVYLLRCAASSVIAAYQKVRLIPSYLRVLHLKLFTLSSLNFYEILINGNLKSFMTQVKGKGRSRRYAPGESFT
jgi:hypothetical protein